MAYLAGLQNGGLPWVVEFLSTTAFAKLRSLDLTAVTAGRGVCSHAIILLQLIPKVW